MLVRQQTAQQYAIDQCTNLDEMLMDTQSSSTFGPVHLTNFQLVYPRSTLEV